MSGNAMDVLMMTLKMGVAGGFGIAILFAMNHFNNFEFKTKRNGGVNSDTDEGNVIRKELRQRG